MKFEEKDILWAKEIFNKIENKMDKMVDRTMGTIPYMIEDGKFNDMTKTNVCFWTNSFYCATIWIMYHQTKKEKYLKAGKDQIKSLDPAFNEYFKLHHDVGFLWQLSAVLDYKLTGDESSRIKGMYAGTLLASRFNIDGEYLRAWQIYRTDNLPADGWAIIDTMMNLSILYWASEQVGDKRFARIAMAHADQTVKNHIRPDGSVKHIVIYDEETGEAIGEHGGQGYAEGSSWTRGQGWAIYGLMNSYHHTKKQEYLEACQRVCNYFIAEISHHDWLPPCDFRSPEDGPELFDSSAGGLAVCGMIELAKVLGDTKGKVYRDSAIKILRAMEAKFANWNEDEDGMIHYGTIRYHEKNDGPEHNRFIIYSDFYFTEAITKILGTDLQIW